jgi:hypothetical protein
MGANPRQAQGVVLFFIAFTFIAGGFAADINWLLMIVGLALLALSLGVFLKCKPWEYREE